MKDNFLCFRSVFLSFETSAFETERKGENSFSEKKKDIRSEKHGDD